MGMGKIKIGSQFSGIGAFEQAFVNIGIPHKTIMAVEWDKYARKTYSANFGEPKHFYEDSYEADYKEVEELDYFLSSPPCQAFSLAGKRLGESDERGILFYETYRFIKDNNPKYFIIENVKGLLSMDEGAVFQNWINLLGQSVNGDPFMFPHEDSLMYNLHWQVLNTKDYGLPQNRERVFLVGIRNDLPNSFVFPKGVPLKLRLKDILEESVDEKYYLSEKMVNYLQVNNKSNGGRSLDFTNADEKEISNCLQAVYYKTPTDGEYLKIPSATKSGFEIATNYKDPKCVKYNDYRIRKLTPREVFRLQGFPDEFVDKNNFIKSINKQGILVYICNEFKNKLLCNVKLKNVIEKQREGDIALCTIKDSESMVTQISFLNTPIEEIKNAKYQVAIEMFTQKDFVYHTTTPIENMAMLYTLTKEGKMLSTELPHPVEKEELEKMEGQSTGLLLKIILDESWKREKSYITSTLIHTIMKSIICMCTNPSQNTLRCIVSYEGLPKKQEQPTKNSLAMESFILKTANTSYVSSSQLYKQAGNSISVPVIQAILKNFLTV